MGTPGVKTRIGPLSTDLKLEIDSSLNKMVKK